MCKTYDITPGHTSTRSAFFACFIDKCKKIQSEYWNIVALFVEHLHKAYIPNQQKHAKYTNDKDLAATCSLVQGASKIHCNFLVHYKE